MTPKTPYHFPLRQAVAIGAKLILLGAATGVIALVAGPLVAAIACSVILWCALALTVRRLHDAEDSRDSELAGIRQEYGSIISAMASAIGLKDDLTAGQALRISDLASILSQQMQIRPEEVQVIQRATVLADVGKLEIAQGILTKQGELSEDEWKEMRRHPELGARILAEVLQMGDAGEIVLAHHERFDGNGYPRGLKGEEIPLGARIFALADSYIAMTSDRPHRKKMTHDQAMREILRSSMTQFDPDVVRAFQRAAEAGLIGPPGSSSNGSDEPADHLPQHKLAEIKSS